MSISRQQRRKKQRITGIDPRKMNKGGYYKGMPGVTLDEHGNRILGTVLVTEDGESHLQLFGPPKLLKLAIQDQMGRNAMVKAIFRGAVVDHLFDWKNPFNWPLRIRYNIWYWWKGVLYKREEKKEKAKHKKKASINKKDGQ